MTNENGYSLSDIRAVTGEGGGMFGGNGAWFLIILFLFAFMGWGGRGWGGTGGADGGIQTNYVLTSDFAQVERKLDGIANGICDSTYALNNTMTNGFAAAQQTMTQGFAGLNTGMVQQGYETRLGIQNIGTQMGQCCCDIREGIAGVNYNNALANAGLQKQISDTGFGIERQLERGFCDNGYALASNTTAIVQNAHNDADRILARIDKMESDRQAERIAQLQSDNSMLKTQIYHDGNVRWLYEQLGPKCPQAAYVVQPPQQVTFPTNCCGGVNYAAAGGCGCGV